jgi:hypothetical protein
MVVERIILKLILRKHGVDWIQQARDRGHYRAGLNMITTFGIHERWGVS